MIDIKKELSKDKPFYNLKSHELGEEVKMSLGFGSGPFTCHGKKSVLAQKEAVYKDLRFKYKTWKCQKCGKEMMDYAQALKYEQFLVMKRLVDDELLSMERSLNYDGKAYFFRFPKEISSNLRKDSTVSIKLLDLYGKMFLVEVRGK